METILRLLPILVCPIIMGLMMWMMHRNNNANDTSTDMQMQSPQRLPVAQEPQRIGSADAAASTATATPFRAVVDMIKCCLNPKVIAGLAVVGVGVLVFAPNLAGTALLLLVALVCPLSMLLMMRGMKKHHAAHSAAQAEPLTAKRSEVALPPRADAPRPASEPAVLREASSSP